MDGLLFGRMQNKSNPALGLFLGFFAIAIVIVGVIVNVVPSMAPKKDSRKEAYEQACRFIEDHYPGDLKISKIENTKIDQVESAWIIIARVDGQNSFGGPVRTWVTVKLLKSNDRWNLESIEQR